MDYSEHSYGIAAEQPVQPVRRRRRRKKRKPPVKELAVCVIVIFLAGFLTGFLVRGAFLSKEEPAAETTVPPETTEPAPQSLLPLDDWRMILVNRWNPVPEGFTVSLTRLANGLEVDKRCYSDLQEMIAACRAAGLEPTICSAYRSLEYQTELYESKIAELKGQGMSAAQAEKEASSQVAPPGASEHHLGLAVDIVDASYQFLTENQEDTAVQRWLLEHSWEYGFILRYPNGKSEITGIIYEPWHYRYVGKEIAADVHASGLCFEEYLQQYR